MERAVVLFEDKRRVSIVDNLPALFLFLLLPLCFLLASLFCVDFLDNHMSFVSKLITCGILFYIVDIGVKSFFNKSLFLSMYYFFFIVVFITIFLDAAIATLPEKLLMTIIIIFPIIIMYFFDVELISIYKESLLEKFLKKSKFHFFIPEDDDKGNYWGITAPEKIRYVDNYGNEINIKDSTITTKRTRLHNKRKNFTPIYNLTVCSMLFNNVSYRQKYFNQLYVGLVGVNFLYYFMMLVCLKYLIDAGYDKVSILISGFIFILLGLWRTISFFVDHIEIERCHTETIKKSLESIATEIKATNVDSHFLTLSNEERISHTDKLKKLKKVNKELVGKVDNIYQIITPLLFLAQASGLIAVLNLCKECL